MKHYFWINYTEESERISQMAFDNFNSLKEEYYREYENILKLNEKKEKEIDKRDEEKSEYDINVN